MYKSELINKVEEGKEYKREILEEFVSKHHYHLYSKTMGSNMYLSGQVMCVIEKIIEGDYHFFYDDGRMVHIEFVKGIVFAELKL